MSEQLTSGPERSSDSTPLSGELETIIRTGRDLEFYKDVFGEELGKGEELILDVGSGDSTVAEELTALTDHKAKIIRLDADYSQVPPEGSSPAVAADAAKMPFADGSFDRVTTLFMLPHLGPEKGADVMSEMLRVLKPGGQALLFPARPFKKVDLEFAEKTGRNISNRRLPTLTITKPEDFDSWPQAQRQEAISELTDYVTYGGIIFKLYKWGVIKTIERAGTKRSLDQGSKTTLSLFKKSANGDREE